MFSQDTVFFVGQILLSLTLIPMIRNGVSVPLKSSGLSVVVLFAFALAFFTLGLIGSACTSTASTVMWLVLFGQEVRRRTVPS